MRDAVLSVSLMAQYRPSPRTSSKFSLKAASRNASSADWGAPVTVNSIVPEGEPCPDNVPSPFDQIIWFGSLLSLTSKLRASLRPIDVKVVSMNSLLPIMSALSISAYSILESELKRRLVFQGSWFSMCLAFP